MRLLAVPLALLALCSITLAADVTITTEGKAHRVKTAAYEAVVDADGNMPNLIIGGTEFLGPQVSRGIYFWQGATIAIPDVTLAADNALLAKGDKGSVRYEFSPTGITLTVTNATAAQMEYVMVFTEALTAVRGPGGTYRKTPCDQTWPTATWFCGKIKVETSGSTHLWGPFPPDKHFQVWQLSMKPNETRTVTIDVGAATPDEAAKAQEAASRVVSPPTDPKGPMWDMKRFGKAPKVYPAEGFEPEGAAKQGEGTLRAIYYDGPPYEGKPTRIFAWLGLPKITPGKKVPAMVLVHGGGGTAFDYWVRLWTSRGYAAIAMDTCGCVPKGTYGNWNRNEEFGGPPGWGGYNQIGEPREDQWTFHAVASAILANSLLRSMPEVDPNRIGLTGISWGGYLTCIIAGADHRFKLAVPVYGCGFYLDLGGDFTAAVTSLGKEGSARWVKWWDPSSYLGAATMPMLWVTGSNDFAYTFPALQESYRLPKSPHTLCIRLRMPHGHGGAGENPEEIHAFADSILMQGDPLAKITGQGRDGSNVWVTYDSKVPVVKAELNITKDKGRWPDRVWVASPAQVEAGRVTATLPDGVTTYYLNLIDQRNLIVSTEHVVLP